MNMTIDELVDNFDALDDWEDKTSYLISLGKVLPPMDAELKTDGAKVSGCLSQVWLVLSWDENNKLKIAADSDGLIPKGLIAILYILFAGLSAEEARAIDLDRQFARIGLEQHLTVNRRNGFYSVLERIKAFISR